VVSHILRKTSEMWGTRHSLRKREADPCGTEFVSGVLTQTLQALRYVSLSIPQRKFWCKAFGAIFWQEGGSDCDALEHSWP